VRALGATLWDENGQQYLDFYGGHAVISIGHSHPHYVQRVQEQVAKIGFYSNSVKIPIQQELAAKLGNLSGYPDYTLFLCNSGAEANENALKLASFHTGKNHVIAFKGAFHGRTSGAVAATDNPKIVAPFNAGHGVSFVPYDLAAVEQVMQEQPVCAVIIEPIQGVGGVVLPSDEFLQGLAALCTQQGVVLIADEVQSGQRHGQWLPDWRRADFAGVQGVVWLARHYVWRQPLGLRGRPSGARSIRTGKLGSARGRLGHVHYAGIAHPQPGNSSARAWADDWREIRFPH
jgi:acetylornithine/succinyldiaminopimelate/putrescine aminotransferase